MKNSSAYKFLKQFGHFTMAYTIVSDKGKELNHYEIPDKGLIGYASYKNLWLMIGDPLCGKSDLVEVVGKFIHASIQQNKIIVGVQSDYMTGQVFKEYGYNATHMGVETILDVKNFDLRGKSKIKVRRWVNTAKNAGIIVKEIPFCKGNIQQAKKISRIWFDEKINHMELNLMTRKSVFGNEEDTRTFFACQHDEIVGYITFDPIYDDGLIIGYYADLCRSKPKPNGIFDIILHFARECFKKEGVLLLSLGISPLSDIQNDSETGNLFLLCILKNIYRFGNSMYAFKGLDFHKKAYHDGIQSKRVPKYYITKGVFPFTTLLKTFEHIGIVPQTGFLNSLLYVGKHLGNEFYEQMTSQYKKI